MAEQLTLNQRVEGSSPSGLTTRSLRGSSLADRDVDVQGPPTSRIALDPRRDRSPRRRDHRLQPGTHRTMAPSRSTTSSSSRRSWLRPVSRPKKHWRSPEQPWTVSIASTVSTSRGPRMTWNLGQPHASRRRPAWAPMSERDRGPCGTSDGSPTRVLPGSRCSSIRRRANRSGSALTDLQADRRPDLESTELGETDPPAHFVSF